MLLGIVLIFLIPAGLILLLVHSLQHPRDVPSFAKHGGFAIHAWYLPEGYFAAYGQRLADRPGLGEMASDIARSHGEQYQLVELAYAAKDDSLVLSASSDVPAAHGQCIATSDGGLLYNPDYQPGKEQTSGGNAGSPERWQLQLPDGRDAAGVSYNLSRREGKGGHVLVLMPDQRLLCLDSSPGSDGAIRLQVAEKSGTDREVDSVADGVVGGGAILGGQSTVALLSSTGKVFVFDFTKDHLVERPEYAKAGAIAAAASADLASFAVCESLIAVHDAGHSRVLVLALNGDQCEFKVQDPLQVTSAGTQRLFPLITADEMSGPDQAAGYVEYNRRLRREGRHTALDRIGDSPDPGSGNGWTLRLIPVDANELAIADDFYSRVLLVRLAEKPSPAAPGDAAQ